MCLLNKLWFFLCASLRTDYHNSDFQENRMALKNIQDIKNKSKYKSILFNTIGTPPSPNPERKSVGRNTQIYNNFISPVRVSNSRSNVVFNRIVVFYLLLMISTIHARLLTLKSDYLFSFDPLFQPELKCWVLAMQYALECFLGDVILDDIVGTWRSETWKERKPMNKMLCGSNLLENSVREYRKHLRSGLSYSPALIHHWLRVALESLMPLPFSIFVYPMHRSTGQEKVLK